MLSWNGEGAGRTCRLRDIRFIQINLVDPDAAVPIDDDHVSGRTDNPLDDHPAELGRSDDNDVSAGDRFLPVHTDSQKQLARSQRRRHRAGSDPRHEGDPETHRQTNDGSGENGGDFDNNHRTHAFGPAIRASCKDTDAIRAMLA